MAKNSIIIKFKNSDSLNHKILNDGLLNQFTYKPIVTDEMLFSNVRINNVNYASLMGICYVQKLENMTLEEKQKLANEMSSCHFVEYAYVEMAMSPILSELTAQKDDASSLETDYTPYFVSTQGYKDGLTEFHKGIDMEYAYSIGIYGQGVTCAVIDGGFNFRHINLRKESFINFDETDVNHEHGTACAAILYGKDSGFGIRGLVYGADKCYAVSNAEESVSALIKILPYLNEGDIVSLSWGSDKYPMDHDLAFWEVAKEATSAGIIICISAGNSSVNLDTAEELEEYRNRPDNGVIRVGAGDRLTLEKKAFSNHGNLIHIQAWGDRVTTAGGKDFYDYIAPVPLRQSEDCKYTFNFFGTSAATPIVASAAVAIQSWYKQQTGNVLSPLEMRNLLIATGNPQKNPERGHVGPMPNIKNAIDELSRRIRN
jgi:subtilisin family serine protease